LRCARAGDEDVGQERRAVVDGHLSPITRAYDYTTKMAMYRRIPSLQQYVLVDPIERAIKSFSRQTKGWLLTDHTPTGILPLPSIDLELTFDQVFAALN
jgi:Uma2 family endonuclease